MASSYSIPSGRVRVIARIRGLSLTSRDRGIAKSPLKPWISIEKPQGDASESVALSFCEQSASQKEPCHVHYCYDQDEETEAMYMREVKPLVSEFLDGRDATIVAYGAVGSGKTYTIQGSEEKPGLAMLAMDEIISTAQRLDKTVTISLYEICQEHAYDLLNPDRQAVTAMIDDRGRVQLKGLSQVPLKSLSEFRKIYLSGSSVPKALQKPETKPPRKIHKGLMVHLLAPSQASPVGKLNFVDLAGYEDPRRRMTAGGKNFENKTLNKSLYTLQKVMLALSANETHVPYRESTLTRMLQDCLAGGIGVVFIACLNPSFCQDSISMASFASRTFQGIRQSLLDSTKKGKSLSRLAPLSSVKARITRSTSASMKKQTGSRPHFFQGNVTTSAIKGKKLFDEPIKSITYRKAASTSTLKPRRSDQATQAITVPLVEKHINNEIGDETISTLTIHSTKMTLPPKEVKSSAGAIESTEPLEELVNQEGLSSDDANCTTIALPFDEDGHDLDKENNVQSIDVAGSPPLSARLREISNNLKLIASTPTCVELPQKINHVSDGAISGETEEFEPRTPLLESGGGNERPYLYTPRGISKTCCRGTKNSLVQEYLRFVNSASKEDLKGLKGIGEKRATYILELREESPEPFKSLDDLKSIGLSAKQIKSMFGMK